MSEWKEHKEERKRASRADRSKYKKTDQDKRKKHLKNETDKRLAKKDLARGRVLAIRPGVIVVDCEDTELSCHLSGHLKKEITRAKNIVTVGDFVLFEKEKRMIAHIEPRRSILSRREHLRRRQEQLIAANIDQVLITVSVASPPLKPFLIDRYIIATHKGNMTPVILVNKIDLLKDREAFDAFLSTYEKLGIKVIPLSVHTGEGVEALIAQMRGKASVFSGQSGVGKSSLINVVTGLKLPVGGMAKKTQKGSHTTSTTHLIPLAFGGWCIDTPGIRSFGLWNLRSEDVRLYFPEIAAKGSLCRFPNCTHSHEPGCAVKEAATQGEISPLRLESFQKLLGEIID